ncbi:T9SS type A sorting domain-containing protein [Jejudonia soesokkakensis]|uniref:T9SS type A sorting domain-containing protein n=1 Tax=Jejudonia soesokkakensis TaxID=1323432 RepID=A0ABW2MR57_9FLAO
MKNLLLLLTLIIGSSALAQSDLFVRPTPSGGDNYIYVKDQILYVEDDINLQKNNTTATEASIYLRDRGQLIQGTNSANTGTGFLSVYQDSYSDSFDYNYWASPVGNPATLGGGAVSGNKRYGIKSLKDSIGATNYRENLLTAGYNGAGSGLGSNIQLSISHRWVYKYENDATGWSRIFAADNISAGYGFTMKGTNVTTHSNQYQDPNNQRYDFRGRPNNGDIVVPMTADGFVLSGNPYPSALDLVAFYNDNPDLNSIIFWDEDRTINSHFYRDNQGGYGSWTVNGTNPGGIYTVPTFMNHDNSGNPTTPTGDVGQSYNRSVSPIGQGFFLVGEPGISGSVPITYSNNHRVYVKEDSDHTSSTNPSIFHRPGQTNGNNQNNEVGTRPETTTRGSIFRFYTVFGESHFRDMILFLNDDTTDGHDRGYDVYHPSDGGGTDASMPITASDGVERQYVMQGVSFKVEDRRKMIPLTIKVSGQNYRVKIQGVEEVNLPGNVYFYDSQTNNIQLISGGDFGGLMLSPGTYKNRFYIVFTMSKGRSSKPDFGIEEAITEITTLKQHVNFFQNNRVSQLEVTNPDRLNIAAANIYDMGGKLVVSQNNIGEESKFNIPTSNLSDGVYLIKLTTAENVIIDYKITVTN